MLHEPCSTLGDGWLQCNLFLTKLCQQTTGLLTNPRCLSQKFIPLLFQTALAKSIHACMPYIQDSRLEILFALLQITDPIMFADERQLQFTTESYADRLSIYKQAFISGKVSYMNTKHYLHINLQKLKKLLTGTTIRYRMTKTRICDFLLFQKMSYACNIRSGCLKKHLLEQRQSFFRHVNPIQTLKLTAFL